jgi:hypothetical protein
VIREGCRLSGSSPQIKFSNPGRLQYTSLLGKNQGGVNMKTRYLEVKKGEELNISDFPNFHKSGSIKGMKDKYYGKDCLLVRCGNWIYNVSSRPEIYNMAH